MVAGSKPIEVNDLSIYIILSAKLGLRFALPLAEMSTRNRKIIFLVSKAAAGA
jgi:hypothetical protein